MFVAHFLFAKGIQKFPTDTLQIGHPSSGDDRKIVFGINNSSFPEISVKSSYPNEIQAKVDTLTIGSNPSTVKNLEFEVGLASNPAISWSPALSKILFQSMGLSTGVLQLNASGHMSSAQVDLSTLVTGSLPTTRLDGLIPLVNIPSIPQTHLDPLGTNLALVTNGLGYIVTSGVTATELGYLTGATSNIQTQINAIVSASGSVTLAGDVTGPSGSNTVAFVGGQSAADVNTSVLLTEAATTASTPNTLVKRTSNGAIHPDTVSMPNAGDLLYRNSLNELAAIPHPDVVSQVLTTTTNNQYVWQAAGGGGSSPLTTKGDLYGRSASADVRIPVVTGAELTEYPLVASSAATNGVAYRNPQKSFFQKKWTGSDCSANIGATNDSGTYNTVSLSGCTGAQEFAYENVLRVDPTSKTSGAFAVTFYSDVDGSGDKTRYAEACYEFSHFTNLNAGKVGEIFAINVCAGNSACTTDGSTSINFKSSQSEMEQTPATAQKVYRPIKLCTTFPINGVIYAGGSPVTTTINLIENTLNVAGTITSNKVHCTDEATDQGTCRFTLKEF